MKIRKIVCLFVSLILIMSTVIMPNTIMASAEADTTKPVIDVSTLTVSPKEATVGDTIRISVKVTDDVKISNVYLHLYSPITNKSESASMKYDIASDRYVFDFVVSNSTEEGVWKIHYIRAKDSSDNDVYCYNSKVSTLSPNSDLSFADFTVSWTHADTTRPIIDKSTLTVSQKEATVGDTIRISVKVTDDVKISNVYLHLYSPITSKSESESMKYDIASDRYVFDFIVSNSTEEGVWKIHYIRAKDSSDNDVYCYNSKVSTLSPNSDLSFADFTVSWTHADTTKPIIDKSSLTVSQKEATVGDTIRISVKVTDDVKVNNVSLYLYSPITHKSEYNNMKYDIASDRYVFDFIISNSTEEGVWKIHHIRAKDSSDNDVYCYNSKVSTLSPNSDLSFTDFTVSATANPPTEHYDFEVAIGGTLSLSYNAKCDIKWISSDSAIAKIGNVNSSTISFGTYKQVSSSCQIIPLKEGIVTIYAADENGYMLNSAVVKVTAKKIILGDVTEDSAINSSDALAVLQHSVGQITLTGDKFTAGDVDKNGTINSSDALKILQYSVGQISEF